VHWFRACGESVGFDGRVDFCTRDVTRYCWLSRSLVV
jgi:hypothetical protein